MSTWPRWSLEGEPAALAKYVHPEEVAALVPLPGPPADSRVAQARSVYEALAAIGITYSHEAPSDEPGRQVVREPGEVLWCPRHGTCLDLALVMAGACLHAGLHPFVVILDPSGEDSGSPSAERAAHALLGVWIGDPRPGGRIPDADVWTAPPDNWPDLVQGDVDGGRPRPVLLLDPVGVARALPTSPVLGTDASFAEAAAAGARYAAEWTWRLAVDVGRAWRRQDSHRTARRPRDEPLRSPYVRLDTEVHRPLEILKAEHAVVPFQARDELTILAHFCRTVAAGPHTGVALVHGVGGAGKTRLALELAEHMSVRDGWYTGYLREGTDAEDWLGVITSPTLIVLDYAEARAGDAQRLLRVLKRRIERGATPAVVVMTARSACGQWLTTLQKAWARDGHLVRECPPLQLPPEHPDGPALFRHAVTSFHDGGDAVDLSEAGSAAPAEWTTLDHILLAFLVTRSPGRVPTGRDELYDEVLEHERVYWAQTYQRVSGSSGDAPTAVLNRAVTCLTLRTPTTRRETIAALRALEELADDARWRETVHDTLTTCLQPAPGEALVLRPDPIADHLTLRELDSDPDLLHHALDGLPPEALLHALRQLNRAAATAPDTAAKLIADWIDQGPKRWRDVLRVAVEQRGAALAALEHLVDATAAPPWLDDLSEAVPISPLGLPQLAAKVLARRLARVRADPSTPPTELADLLRRLSLCQAHSGALREAIASIGECVDILRDVRRTDPAAAPDDFAMALSQLAGRQVEAGEFDDALVAAVEAANVLRPLARSDPDSHQGDLAIALVNLTKCQSSAGDDPAALVSISEAVDILRPLAASDPAEHLPYLAIALNNLAACQARLGDRGAALTSGTDAAKVYRQLVTIKQAAPPDLAIALTNLCNQQRHVGDVDGSLASITEAVDILQHHVFANPAVYLPLLSSALINLSASRIATGDDAAALASAGEAVDVLRRLSRTNPVAHASALSGALNNLALLRRYQGDHEAAMAAATEAVELVRPLARTKPAAHLPALASTLIGLAGNQSASGDHAAAEVSADQAVTLLRPLAEASPDAFRPDLCDALTLLGVQMEEAGRHETALTTLAEAVAIGRELTSAASDTRLSKLATALNNLSKTQRSLGELGAALTSGTEAAEICRTLTGINPALYLPDLATNLANLSFVQCEAGDPRAALASGREAVEHSRRLARAKPARHLRDLAAALNNLSAAQRAMDDAHGALASITEAVTYLRHLASAHPAVYAVAHATALSNLSVDQRTVGDHSAALASSAEAVDILRPLAEDDPAHLPLLAITLNNLSTRQSRAGDVQGALASITEVVEMRRELAETNPTAFLPALATALNNRAYRLTETGDRRGALVCVDEAVTILRTFADAHPAAYLPRLACFLTHLSQCQEDDGQGRAAASSATEAVPLFRCLTRANPSAHLSGFVTALNRFTALRHDPQTTLDVWADAVTALGANPVPQAELRARYAGQLAEHGALDKALEQLVHAALVDDMEEPHLLCRVRQAIRTTVAEHGLDDDRLPDWATSPLPDAAIRLANEWAATSDWHHAEAFLRAHGEQLMAPGLRHDLQVTAAILPGHAEIGNLTGLLDAIDSHGIEQILAGGRRTQDARLALRSWLGTDDWQTSKDFLDEPENAVYSPEAKGLLRHARSQVADQHLAILELSEVMPTDEVYAIVVDQGTAVEQAYQAIERADIQALRRILAAHDGPFSGAPAALFEAVNHLADGDTEAARRLAVLLARNGAFNQRTAYAILLRALASHDPDLLFAEELADIVASDGTALDPARGTDEGHGERVTQ